MNDYAGQLAKRLVAGEQATSPTPALEGIPGFLKTKQGKEAVRSAVDYALAKRLQSGDMDTPMYEDVLKTLMGQMGTTG